MKILLGVLLLVGMAWAGEHAKPYDGSNVLIKATQEHAGNIRIDAESVMWISDVDHRYRRFIFSCSVGAPRCVAPKVGWQYILLSPPTKPKCDGYNLGGDNKDNAISVCLVSVTVKEQ